MLNNQPKDRYTCVAIALHWAMAIAFLLMLGSGLAFDNIPMEKSFKFSMYQWHKSLGLILLTLFFVRIGWRLFHKPPMLPSSITRLDRLGAKWGHIGLYAMMFLIPLSGWMMVSSSPYGLPTFIFGWFEWPHIPFVAGNALVNDGAKETHEILAFAFMGLIAAHIAGTIKHIIKDKVNLLPRMGIGRADQE